MTEQIRPGALPGDPALCGLPGCGQQLYIGWTASMAIELAMTDDDLASETAAHTRTWSIACGAGHVVLLPPDTAADYYEFGQCDCGLPDHDDPSILCSHRDLDRLRKVLADPEDYDGICRKEGCPNLGGVWRDCPEETR